VIASFHDEETRKIWQGSFSRKLPPQIQVVARRKLCMLNNARALDDLRVPPNNRLESLHGDRDGQYSIRINEQWRLCSCGNTEMPKGSKSAISTKEN
jgi:proteic killer suppression protein